MEISFSRVLILASNALSLFSKSESENLIIKFNSFLTSTDLFQPPLVDKSVSVF
jgi:hypothetical protein